MSDNYKVPGIGDDDAAADALEQGVTDDIRSDELDELANAAAGDDADVDALTEAMSSDLGADDTLDPSEAFDIDDDDDDDK
ncbi:MAG: hypothetical protein GC159_19375 [Phycisphaera sp.]|nr:hypothetical protein [Phycisphaera sp.]